jgi:hypothetical protein
VQWRLFATAYDLGIYEKASRSCEKGGQRAPQDRLWVQCRLYLGIMDDHKPDVAAAWRDAAAFAARTPEPGRPLAARMANMLAAAQIARSGLADSARHVIMAARADRSIDPSRELLGLEALVRVRLGERREALQLIKQFLTEFPLHRAGLTRNTWWWKDLKDDPEFKALVGTNR